MVRRKTNEEFVQEIFSLVGSEYIFLEEYKTNKDKLLCRHNECSNEWLVSPNHFLSGLRCSVCTIKEVSKKRAKTNQEFKDEIFNLTKGGYEFIDEYVNAVTKLRVTHKECGHTYKVTPSNFIHKGNRCPRCTSSHGETAISNCLTHHNIPHSTEHYFKDLGVFRYDFYLPYHNLLIEYDGIQHFDPIEYFGGEETLRQTQKHDKIKNDYAMNNGYKLYRIPYWELDKLENYATQLRNKEIEITFEEILDNIDYKLYDGVSGEIIEKGREQA